MVTYRVSYHRGSLCALVEAETPARAVEIARAHREAKRLWSRKPPQSVRDDSYDIVVADERDIRWARKFGTGVLTDMPQKARKGRSHARKRLEEVLVGPRTASHVGAAFPDAA